MPKLEALRLELRELIAVKQRCEKELESLEIDVETVKEEIRMELEENYHL